MDIVICLLMAYYFFKLAEKSAERVMKAPLVFVAYEKKLLFIRFGIACLAAGYGVTGLLVFLFIVTLSNF